MKTFQLATAAVLFFAAITAFARTPPADTSLSENSVFQRNCAKCHGKTAEGRHFAGPSLVSEATAAVPADELRFQNEQEIYGIEELPITW